jgi:hypothetical protein
MAYRGLLRLAILMSVLSFSASDRVRGENVSTSGIPKPRTIHNYPMAGHAIDNDAQARAVVDDILKHFGFTSAAWKIWVTSNPDDTPYAMARYWPDGTREVIFNKEFIRTFLKTKVNGRHTVSPHTRLDIIFAYIWKPGRLIFVKPSFKRIITAGSFLEK